MKPAPAVLAGAPLLIAHRGGRALYPENTIFAFERAVRAWRADMLELDVCTTRDGACIVLHDPTVDRTTDGAGRADAMTLAEVQALDAGYRFTPDNGRTFPYRGQGITIPTIDEVLRALPDQRITIEIKIGSAQRPVLDAIAAHRAGERIVLASERDRHRTQFHAWQGVRSASLEQGKRFYLAHRFRVAALARPRADAFQIPEEHKGRRIVTPRFVRDAHRAGMHVHIWTVNERADMERLLDWGVDGLVTDRPDTLAQLLHERVDRPLPPGDPDLPFVP